MYPRKIYEMEGCIRCRWAEPRERSLGSWGRTDGSPVAFRVSVGHLQHVSANGDVEAVYCVVVSWLVGSTEPGYRADIFFLPFFLEGFYGLSL